MASFVRFLAIVSLLLGPAWAQADDQIDLVVIRPGVYLHRTFMNTGDFGKVDCNGLVYVMNGEALVIDTPPTEDLTRTLLDKVEGDLEAKVIGVVVGHTHADSMGGLAVFQRAGIPSYASRETQRIAAEKGLPIPRAGFQSLLELKVGGRPVVCGYFGPGHAADTSVTYLVQENVLFGGCLVKALGAGRGFLGDANLSEWSPTVRKVRDAFPRVEVVVPGHGDIGDRELLEFTIEMFAD